MEQTTICRALDRIETALGRIEAAAAQTPDLRKRHERLKDVVRKSLTELDGLIARKQS